MMSQRAVLIVWMEPKADRGNHSYLILRPKYRTKVSKPRGTPGMTRRG